MREIEGLKGLLRFRKAAEMLKEKGLTVNLMVEGGTVVRMGAEADPGLLSIFGPVEVKDLKGILKLFKA